MTCLLTSLRWSLLARVGSVVFTNESERCGVALAATGAAQRIPGPSLLVVEVPIGSPNTYMVRPRLRSIEASLSEEKSPHTKMMVSES
jgi:hypothetical protein